MKYKNSKVKSMIDKEIYEIKEKIKEAGELWRNSSINPLSPKHQYYHRIKAARDQWSKLIDDWINDSSIPLVVRKGISKRGTSIQHPDGREIIYSDNTMATWVFSNVLNGQTLNLCQIKVLLKCKQLPMVFIATADIKKQAEYIEPLGSYALKGWKLCHIKPVGFNDNQSISEIKMPCIIEHFRNYANPQNMFVLPKEIGYLGEIQEFIQMQV